MELEDMKQLWEDQNKRLDIVIRLNASLLQRSNLDKARGAVRQWSIGILLEVVLNVCAIFLLGWFLADHLTEPRFVIPAVALDVYAIALTGALIRQLVAASDIDYGAAVVAIQKKLGLLKIGRLQALKWTLLFAPLMWVPLQIVALKGLFGLDIYAYVGSGYIIANVLFGLAMIPLAIWISRRYAGQMERSPLIQGLMNTIAGSALSAAASFVSTVHRFEEAED